MDARQVIIEPVVSEKSYALMADGKYTFRVADRAHKTQIARAVEEIFQVRVAAVRIQGDRERAPRDPELTPGIRVGDFVFAWFQTGPSRARTG